jgi:nucleotide-binding universal stress UspA family protein
MYQRILVPLDGSATAERGLREAIALASALKARLCLLHVLDDFPMRVEMSSTIGYDETLGRMRQYGQDLLARAKQAAAEAGVPADILMREIMQFRIADAIIDEARKADCDLIVMGTHGRRGFHRLAMGSEAELVVRMSPLPVLLVRQEEKKSSV